MSMKIEEVQSSRRYEILSMFDVDATHLSKLKLEMIMMNRIGLMIQRLLSLQHLNEIFAFLYTPKDYCMRGYVEFKLFVLMIIHYFMIVILAIYIITLVS